MSRMVHLALTALAMALIPGAAFAHTGAGTTASFAAGLAHPFSGLDHIAVMLAVGLWAVLKGSRAIWIWPLAFVSVMLMGGALGMAQISLPLVEPAILSSVVALGLLVALSVDLPVWLGAAIIGGFAIFHGHAHGTEVPETARGVVYMAGFALATAGLHLAGIALALSLAGTRWRALIRLAGAACVLVGVALAAGLL